MDIARSQSVAQPAWTHRLRHASLAFHAGTIILMSFPAINALLYRDQDKVFWDVYVIGAILLWLWGSVTLARDPRLKVLMPFGTRFGRETVAQAQGRKLILDEFDFHLRSEAFRISYQVVATLIALLATAAVVLWALQVRVEWSMVLLLVCPFGIFWLLGLPTAVVVWLTNPAEPV
jgi:hypothetical protein